MHLENCMELSAKKITALHDQANTYWHAQSSPLGQTMDHGDGLMDQDSMAHGFAETILAQHQANYDLWHVEDAARALSASDSDVVAAKRLIDITNQRRNDLTEQIDELLLASLPAHPSREGAPLHSETPGLIIDRLSILSLKLYHTREEIYRPGAPAGHAERNRGRLAILRSQRDDLSICLDQLWQAVLQGDRRFKLYRQLKMYNDPSLNPALYKAGIRD